MCPPKAARSSIDIAVDLGLVSSQSFALDLRVFSPNVVRTLLAVREGSTELLHYPSLAWGHP